MNIKLKTILESRDILKKLSETPLKVSVSYNLAKLVKAVNAELGLYDAERIKLCEKHGRLDKNGNSYVIDDMQKFNEDYNELVNQTVELDVKPLKIDDNIKLTAQELIVIEPFLEVSE